MKHGKLEVSYHNNFFTKGRGCWAVCYTEKGYWSLDRIHHFGDHTHRPNWRWMLASARKCRAQVKQWISEEITK